MPVYRYRVVKVSSGRFDVVDSDRDCLIAECPYQADARRIVKLLNADYKLAGKEQG